MSLWLKTDRWCSAASDRTAYGIGRFLGWVVKEKRITPHMPVRDKSKRDDGTFSRDDVTFDRRQNLHIC